MTSNSDPRFNLADALSEDIVAASADTLVHDAESDPGGRAGLVTSFDRIAARAVAQSRRRRIAARLRGMLQAVPAPIGWTSAVAAVAGVFAVGVVGGLHFQQTNQVAPVQQQAARVSPPILADRLASKYAPDLDNRPLAYTQNPAARVDQPAASPSSPAVASMQPSPPAVAAAPPVVAAAPPPAPSAAAGVADAPRPVPTVKIQAETEAGANALPPRVLASDMIENALRDYQIALAIERQANAAESLARAAPAPAPPASSYAPATLGPAAPARSAKRDAVRQDDARQGDLAPSFTWPLRGRVLAAFGVSVGGVPNNGIDVAAPVGTDIRAAEGGFVAYAGALDGFGNMILLRHPDGYLTVYAHAQSMTVKPGDTVRRGQVIAKSGQTGAATAPQLHFEIRKGTTAVNPAQYLPPPG
jgi:murein DD-endopeptidase MepM/ murein hydrolase activator NlpD